MINPWKVLGVHRQSTEEDVRTAYLALAKMHHPDKGGRLETFQNIVIANSILCDKKKRSIFIKDMLIRNKECFTCKGVGATVKFRGLTKRDFTACNNCGGAGVIIANREEGHVTIELQSSGTFGGKRDHYKRKPGGGARL